VRFKITRSAYDRIIKEERSLARRVGRTLTVGRLREALVQRGYQPLVEGEVEEGGDSLDRQLDRYLNQYLKVSQESIRGEARDLRSAFRRFLYEADEDDADAEPSEDEKAPDDAGTDDVAAESKPGVDDVDVEKFVDEVVNFIQNFQNLLEVKGTVVRRATKLLKEKFDDSVVKSFEDILMDKHSIEPGRSEGEVEADQFVAPYAGEAGPVA
jgi:hypothetical protein